MERTERWEEKAADSLASTYFFNIPGTLKVRPFRAGEWAARRVSLPPFREGSERMGHPAFESMIRADATFGMPPDFGAAEGGDVFVKVKI